MEMTTYEIAREGLELFVLVMGAIYFFSRNIEIWFN